MCYIYVYIYIYHSEYVQYGQVSEHLRSRTVLWLLRRGGATTDDFFRCTEKNLVAYVTSWSLTLSPERMDTGGPHKLCELLYHLWEYSKVLYYRNVLQ